MEEKCVAWGACGSASAKLVGQDEAETVNSLRPLPTCARSRDFSPGLTENWLL